MSNTISGAAQSAATGNTTASTTTATAKNAVNKETFLQLLVAQIRHQNPLNPADGVQFLTQLAQFSELEQLMTIGSDIAAVREELSTKNKTEETQNV